MKQETRSTCPYCGVGCGVIVESDGVQITGVRGDPAHPANFGRLCTKGSTLALTTTREVTLQTRLLHPMLRTQRGTPAARIGWNEALTLAADRFADTIRDHGPDAVGFYISGQLLTEDYYVFNKLAKGLIGTNNIDTNSRLCMSSAVAGYKATLGADAPPACYDDLALAGTLFFAGSNAAYAHPILYRRIEDAKRANPALRTVVVDPRRTETAEAADLHLQILPGTDVALFHGMLNVMLRDGLVDRDYIDAHTNNFDGLIERVKSYQPSDAAAICGIDEASLVQAAHWFAGLDVADRQPRRPTLSLYCQGLNQSSNGTTKNAALINLHLATRQIGVAGAGPFSLTGQPNAMGGREVGGMANLLSGHRDLANPAHRAEVAKLWGLPDVPAKHGKTAVEMFQAAADGEIKALWIACTNPAQSMPDQSTVRRALQRAEFVVVQEAFSTGATCAFADLLLPATTWGEKDGTVTNSERRISRVRVAVEAPGQTRHDWAIATDFAQRLESRLQAGVASRFAYGTAESVWNEHRETTRGRDLDITGLSYAQLDVSAAQWPFPEGATIGRSRLYEDGVYPTADGRARFDDADYAPLAEPAVARYPFLLNTGRLRDQWHSMSRTGTAVRLFGQVPEPSVDLHPDDMTALGLKDGDLAYLTSRRGAIVLPARAATEVARAQAFVAMHWGPEHVSGRSASGKVLAGINAITNPAYCPRSKQPELKASAIKVLKAELPARLVAAAWLPANRVLAVREELAALMSEFHFATCVPFGRERTGVLFRAASVEPAAPELMARIEALLGLDAKGVLRYVDDKRGQRRSMRLGRGTGATSVDEVRLDAFMLAGDTAAEAWIRVLLQDELPVEAYGRLLLMPGAKAPVKVADRGRQVCSCFNVGEVAIDTTLATLHGTPDTCLAQLQQQLKCGTNCGSCLPELKRMIRTHMQAA